VDTQIRRLAFVIIGLFVLLFVQVTVLQAVRNDELVANPANAKRQIIQEYETDRGTIFASDGKTVLAESAISPGELRFQRHYPKGELFGHVTGFYSFVYGTSNLERSYNPALAARDESLLPQNLLDQLAGRPKVGASIVTTIDPKVQQVAVKALKGREGAVVAMDPQTGDILALVSHPPYDPNSLSSHDGTEIRRSWERYERDPAKPLLSKANEELYPPGSTFKIVTAAAALESGYAPDSMWPNPQTFDLPQTDNVLENFGGSHCVGGAAEISLTDAFTTSCDVTFAEIGMDLGPDAMAAQAQAFGFDQDIPFDVPYVDGHFPEDLGTDDPLLAYASLGQGDVAANPLQMALVGSAVANDGVLMRPRLVSQILAPDGAVLQTIEPVEQQTSVSSQTAAELTVMMERVVSEGTGTSAQIAGVDVAGKTGTAQHDLREPPHVWFVAFAPASDPEVAVAVVLLNGGGGGDEATGGALAGPVAKQVMEVALGGKRG